MKKRLLCLLLAALMLLSMLTACSKPPAQEETPKDAPSESTDDPSAPASETSDEIELSAVGLDHDRAGLPRLRGKPRQSTVGIAFGNEHLIDRAPGGQRLRQSVAALENVIGVVALFRRCERAALRIVTPEILSAFLIIPHGSLSSTQ